MTSNDIDVPVGMNLYSMESVSGIIPCHDYACCTKRFEISSAPEWDWTTAITSIKFEIDLEMYMEVGRS